MQFRYQPPYLNKNLNTWFKGTVNARYTSKIVCLSFFCKFIKFAHTIQWGFLQNFLFGHFYVFRELFCLFQHILATVQPKIHLNTKFEILPFGWTKCPKTEPFFLKLPIFEKSVFVARVHVYILFCIYKVTATNFILVLHMCIYLDVLSVARRLWVSGEKLTKINQVLEKLITPL